MFACQAIDRRNFAAELDNGSVELDPSIQAYYEQGNEAARLSGGFPSGPLEFARTQELLLRFLPEASGEILDVGGGPGIYAAWLTEQGHHVHVIDPIPLHIQQATSLHPGVTAEVGDARELRRADASVDVVLLMGPLYHLVERHDRRLALTEAFRVLRPGGLLFAATIMRFAALLDLLVRSDRLHEPEVFPIVERSVRTGMFGGPGEGGLFTTSYFHLPREVTEEIGEAGFDPPLLFSIEGPGSLLQDFTDRWADPGRREAILRAARLVESNPEMLAASSHLLAVARRPSTS